MIEFKSRKYEAGCGAELGPVIKEMIDEARKHKCNVELKFNGVTLLVDKDSDINRISSRYHQQLMANSGRRLEPKPSEVITIENGVITIRRTK